MQTYKKSMGVLCILVIAGLVYISWADGWEFRLGHL